MGILDQSKKPSWNDFIPSCIGQIFRLIVGSILVFLAYQFLGKMFYTLSFDLIGLPVKVIHTGNRDWLKDITPDSKYGILNHTLYEFEANTFHSVNTYLEQFLNNRYAILEHSPWTPEKVLELETGKIIKMPVYEAEDGWQENIRNLFDNGAEIYKYNNSYLIIIKNPEKDSPNIYVLHYSGKKGEAIDYLPILNSRGCEDCTSRDGNYYISYDSVISIDGEIVLNRELMVEYGNPWFYKQYFTIVGWSTDGSGVYVSYGKSYLYKFGLFNEGRVRLPSRTLYIPIPLP